MKYELIFQLTYSFHQYLKMLFLTCYYICTEKNYYSLLKLKSFCNMLAYCKQKVMYCIIHDISLLIFVYTDSILYRVTIVTVKMLEQNERAHCIRQVVDCNETLLTIYCVEQVPYQTKNMYTIGGPSASFLTIFF